MTQEQISNLITTKVQELNNKEMSPLLDAIAYETGAIKVHQQNITKLQEQVVVVKDKMTDLSKTLDEAFKGASTQP